jgi:hypothetical protein
MVVLGAAWVWTEAEGRGVIEIDSNGTRVIEYQIVLSLRPGRVNRLLLSLPEEATTTTRERER